jgi:hypothetical protein
MPKIRRQFTIGDVKNETDRKEFFDEFTKLAESGAFDGAEVSIKFEVTHEPVKSVEKEEAAS